MYAHNYSPGTKECMTFDLSTYIIIHLGPICVWTYIHLRPRCPGNIYSLWTKVSERFTWDQDVRADSLENMVSGHNLFTWDHGVRTYSIETTVSRQNVYTWDIGVGTYYSGIRMIITAVSILVPMLI